MNQRDLFISHSSGDADMARELRAVLEGAGYTCWMAPDDVIGTTPWAAQILNAIETSRAMLVLVSSHSNQSTHVSREVELAMSRGRAVFPIRVEAVPPSGALEYHIAGLQRIDAFPPPIANHRDRILLRLALAVPLAGLAASPPTLDAAPQAPTEPQALPPTQPQPPMLPPALPLMPPAVPPPVPPPLQPMPPPLQPMPPPVPVPARGLGAWARANAMLAGSIVTLVALFVVATLVFALNGGKPGPSPTQFVFASGTPTTDATAATSEAPSLPPSEPPQTEAPAPGGAFPNQAEQALFAALPDYGKGLIADCDRDTSGDGVPIAAITCDADNGDLMFYELYADVATQQSEYRDWVEIIMGSPTGSCAKADSGDAAWSKAGTARGHLACYVAEDGGADFYWTDEQKLITVYWYGETGQAPGTTHSIGYQLFLDWTAN